MIPTLNDIPEILKQYPNWVSWRLIVREGKPTKIPFDVKTEYPAKADDPTTWTTYEEVMAAIDPTKGKGYSGPGFELQGTDIVGIDFDHAITKKGMVAPYVLAILKLLGNPYTEISPSGTGVHSFVRCDALPEGGRKLSQGHDGIEIYHGREGGRYFTITGNRVLGKDIPTIADISLPYLLISQSRDKTFKNLWLGDTSYFDGDDSSADFALMCRLATLTQNDPAKMEKYFGESVLGQREKWTDRLDYRQRTINAAIEKNRTGKDVKPSAEIEFHSDPVKNPPNNEYMIAPMDGQEDGWFPLGDISLIGGASGTGKTTWVFDMLHKQKQGWPVLGHATYKRLFHVLAYDRGQNAFERTMRRLKMLPSDIPTTPLPLSFGSNAVQTIINEIEKMKPVPQVIFLEGLDMLLDDTNKKSTVSPFMRQLQEVAAHFHIALIGSLGAPKTKRGEDYAAKRDHLSGSEAWGRNCETVAILEFSEEDDGTAPQRELTVLPRNATAEKFSLQFEGGRLIQVTPHEESEDGGPRSEAVREAIAFLESELQSGPKPAKILIRDAHDLENISRPNLFRAAKQLHVQMENRIAGIQVWALPRLHADSTPKEPTVQSTVDLDFGGS